MIVVCPNCKASYTIPDEKMPKRRAVAVCKKCRQQIVIEPEAADQSDSQHESQQAPETEGPSELAIQSFNSLLTADFPQLRSLPPDKFAFWKIFLPNAEGGYKNPANTLKYKLLMAVAPVLDQLLADPEKVLFVSGAIARSPIDWLVATRLLTGLYNRYALIGTSRRLLLIQVDARLGKSLHYIFQYPYESILKTGRGIRKGAFVFRSAAGRRWILQAMKHAADEAVYEQVRECMDQKGDLDVAAEPGENICGSCFRPFEVAAEVCPHCQSIFKSPFVAATRSLILPGLGNFYLGRSMIGVLQMLAAVVLWLVVLDAFTAGQTRTLAMALYMILVYNGIVGILTFLAARKGYRLDKPGTRKTKNETREAKA